MSTATITFTDCPDGTTNVRIDFGEGGLNNESAAHYFAAKAVTVVHGAADEADDEGDDE